MNGNQNIQQLKLDPKRKAMASFVMGIFSSIFFLIGIIDFWCFISPSQSIGCYLNNIIMKSPTELIIIIGIFQIPLLPLIGLILGIAGLKSSKKNLAKIGIVFCSLSFIGSAILLLFNLLYALGL